MGADADAVAGVAADVVAVIVDVAAAAAVDAVADAVVLAAEAGCRNRGFLAAAHNQPHRRLFAA